MKLYEAPPKTKVRLTEDATVPPAHRPMGKGEVVTYIKTDGMYSLCANNKGEFLHPAAFSEVEQA